VIAKNIKQKIIAYCSQYELYFKIKYSVIIYFFLKQLNANLKNSLKKEYTLYKEALKGMPSNALIFDIGANVGNNVEIFLRLGGSIIAVEPDTKNLRCLSARFSKNTKVSIIPKALSDSSSQEIIYIQDDGTTLHTLSLKWKNYLTSPKNNRWENRKRFSKKQLISTISLNHLIDQYGMPYYIKIDVEGYEEKVIKGLDRKIPLISFEANLPEFLVETLNCLEYLNKLNDQSTYNYSTSDRLILPNFVNYREIIEIVTNTDLRYMDIYCRTQVVI